MELALGKIAIDALNKTIQKYGEDVKYVIYPFGEGGVHRKINSKY